MTPADDLAALEPVADALDALRVEFYVGGSAASSAHGFARATIDIDLVAALRHEHVDRLVSMLAGAYYADAAMIHKAIDASRAFNLIHLATMYKIDVFAMRDRPYDRLARTRTRPQPLSAASERLFRVASPEDVILSKLEWYRAGGEVSERQWQDVIGVMQVQEKALDRRYLSQWAAALGLRDLLDRASGACGKTLQG
jgi:hypothetical protein